MNSKRIILIDASSLNASGCLRQYVCDSIIGYTNKGPVDVSMHYGSAFHLFKEVLKRYKNPELATACGQMYFKMIPHDASSKKEFLNVMHLSETFYAYIDKFGSDGMQGDNYISLVDSNGAPLIEQTVSIPYYSDDLFEVILCGTIDDIGQIKNGCYLIEDTKTTTSWNQQEYFSGYALSHQLMFYLLIVKWLAQHKGGIFAEMVNHRIGCAINGVFLSSSKATEFVRGPVNFYGQTQMEEFEMVLDSFIEKLVMFLRLRPNGLPIREGILNQSCQGRFPGKKCKYFKCCAEDDEVVAGHHFNNMFNIVQRNPLEFRRIPDEITQLIERWPK